MQVMSVNTGGFPEAHELARRVEREGYTEDNWRALEELVPEEYAKVRKPGRGEVWFDYRGDGDGADIVGSRPTDSRDGELRVLGEPSGPGVETVKVMLSEDEEKALSKSDDVEGSASYDPPHSFSPGEEAFGTYVTLVYGIESGEFDTYTEEAERLARRTAGARKVEEVEIPVYEYPTFNVDFLPDKDEVRVGIHVISTPRYLQGRLWELFPEDSLDEIEIKGTEKDQMMNVDRDAFKTG